jgi:rhombotail lipoprotein
MLSLTYVSEVIVVQEHVLGKNPDGFERLRALGERFNFDLIAVIASDQAAFDMRNFRSLGWITYFGDKLWLGDVDQALTHVELAMVEPDSRTLVLRAASSRIFGDSTSVFDDWRSSDYVRLMSFDQARELLIDDLYQQLAALRPRVEQLPR